MSTKALQKVGEVEILGVRYDLAKNGSFALVEPKEADAYGRPVAREVSLDRWLGWADGHSAEEKLQALLDLLGNTMVELAATKAALQREASPEHVKRPAVVREGGITAGVLEKGE